MSKVIIEFWYTTMDMRMAIQCSVGWNIGYKRAIILGKESIMEFINKIRD